MSEQTTPFEVKCEILSDLWMNYKVDEEFKDFIEYNDIGLPMAFIVSEDMAVANERGKAFIQETFDLLLASLGINKDTGFDSLDDLLVG